MFIERKQITDRKDAIFFNTLALIFRTMQMTGQFNWICQCFDMLISTSSFILQNLNSSTLTNCHFHLEEVWDLHERGGVLSVKLFCNNFNGHSFHVYIQNVATHVTVHVLLDSTTLFLFFNSLHLTPRFSFHGTQVRRGIFLHGFGKVCLCVVFMSSFWMPLPCLPEQLDIIFLTPLLLGGLLTDIPLLLNVRNTQSSVSYHLHRFLLKSCALYH